jgi:hypothetical protein
MPKFLTVKEAANLTGKSPSSIRRIIYPILENPKHPDRHSIEPSDKEAKALRLKGENFPWKLSEELIHKEISEGRGKRGATTKTISPDRGAGSAVVIEMLQRELEIKNKQIETQNELLKGLSERLREGNILMGTLQQQLALTDGKPRSKPDAVDANESSSFEEEGSQSNQKSHPKKTHWLFKKIF